VRTLALPLIEQGEVYREGEPPGEPKEEVIIGGIIKMEPVRSLNWRKDPRKEPKGPGLCPGIQLIYTSDLPRGELK
jgi:hypothetical protein